VPRIVCISQARMTSTRLPGKVLLPAAGQSLLGHHLGRLQRCRRVDAVVMATTVNTSDDPLVALAASLGVAVFRGDEADVLGRYAGAAAEAEAELVIRVTSDCPLIDPVLIDGLIGQFLEAGPDRAGYASIDTGVLPRGLDAEIFPRARLDDAARHATAAADREHVTPYIRRATAASRLLFRDGDGPSCADLRWCVDEAADFELIRRMLEALIPEHPDFGWRDALAVIRRHPDWAELNRHVQQKPAA
jgi:spore coat polysaccharide biosynthesis protein SpsF